MQKPVIFCITEWSEGFRLNYVENAKEMSIKEIEKIFNEHGYDHAKPIYEWGSVGRRPQISNALKATKHLPHEDVIEFVCGNLELIFEKQIARAKFVNECKKEDPSFGLCPLTTEEEEIEYAKNELEPLLDRVLDYYRRIVLQLD